MPRRRWPAPASWPTSISTPTVATDGSAGTRRPVATRPRLPSTSSATLDRDPASKENIMTTNEGTSVKPVTDRDGKGDKGGASPFGPVGIRGNPKQTYSPWLVVRYAPGDIGDRPLAPGAVFWESPDVWVVSSRGLNQPVPRSE